MNDRLSVDDTGLSSLARVTASAVMTLPLAELVEPDSPRSSGLDEEHARLLADSDGALPPILINRRTMRVVDGAHRLLAAKLCRQQEIDVIFCDCDDDDAFVLAVKSNVTHGLPLSHADRSAAALRIIGSHPQWSDRMIASVTGLSHRTVGAIRRRSTGDSSQSNARRRGRDGRVRPVDGTAGRVAVTRLLADRQHASLREIAREAGVSPDTVRNVRNRIQRGENPVLSLPRSGQREAPSGQEVTPRARTYRPAPPNGFLEKSALVRSLRNDPSLRFSEAGRTLLRLLGICALNQQEWLKLSETVPAHRAASIAQLAREYGQAWQNFAVAVEQRQRDLSSV